MTQLIKRVTTAMKGGMPPDIDNVGASGTPLNYASSDHTHKLNIGGGLSFSGSTLIGLGDMLKSVYDIDDDGVVDNSELVGGKAETEFALLAGRVGGQTLYGGTGTLEELLLFDNPVNGNGVKMYQNALGLKSVELLIGMSPYLSVRHASTGEDYTDIGVQTIIRTSGAGVPNPSALLDLTSTTMGFLLPRMTTAQRDLITPVAGLIIYNTTTNELNKYNGSSWVALLPTALASAKVLVGNGSGVATAVTLSGDVTNDNAGVTAIGNDKVTYAKMQNVSTNNRLLGRATAGAGDVEEITLGGGLSLSGSTLIGTIIPSICNGRLTLTSGVPVTTSDVTGAGTLYFTPYRGNQVALYDGSDWALYTLTERSLALTLTSDKNYDVFIYNNAGTLTLELSAAWTNDTTRADALTTQDGVIVKSGATTRRWLGIIRASGTNTTEDSVVKRFVLNANNDVEAPLFSCPAYNNNNASNTYIHTSTSYAEVNGGTGSRIAFLSNGKDATIMNFYLLSTGGLNVGIGIDSATSAHFMAYVASNYANAGRDYGVVLSEGYHFLALLASRDIAGTTTVYADALRMGSSADPYMTSISAKIHK